MVSDYDFQYGKKQKYIITYKNLLGEEKLVEGDALSRINARRLFGMMFHPLCGIVKIQTSEEWVNETAEDVANGLMKHVKPLFSTKKQLINPEDVRKIDYNSKSFLRGLKKVNDLVERLREMSEPDNEKKYLSFNN